MIQQQTVFGLPVSHDPYIKHGWCLVPIAPNSKGPKTKDWNKQENCITTSVQLPPGWGIGLAHAYSGTMALDIDDWEQAKTYLSERNIDLDALFAAPDAVTIESGNKGHGKLLYAMPFGLALNSKKLIHTDSEGVKKNFLDFRCATRDGLTVQDVLPPSIHPISLQPYRFGGHGRWERLPTIPMPLLDLWQSLLDEDDKVQPTPTPMDTSWDDIQAALAFINPDLARDDWVMVGMALHDAGTRSNQVDEAYSLWDGWSSKGSKYRGQRDTSNVWRSFEPDEGVTVASLFHLAKAAGWTPPPPDITQLFSAVAPASPDVVIDYLTLRTPPPEINLDLFPSILAQRAYQVSESVGCDPAVPLWAGMGAVCAALDSRARLEIYEDFQVPPVLWMMTIGDPSDMKTPGAKPMFEPLQMLEREDIDRHKAAHLIWKGQEAAHSASMKAFLDAMGQASAQLANDAPPVVVPLPPEPKNLRLVVNDATSQKMVHMSQGREYGFLLHLDEMGHWINRVNDPRSGDDRGCWIAGYESRRYVMDRVGSGTIESDCLSVSLYGNVQPRVFKEACSKMGSDGMLQRFIPVPLDSNKTRLGVPMPAFMTNKGEYEQLIRRLRAIDPKTYHLSPDASKEFRVFQEWYHQFRKDERLLGTGGTYMEALGKLTGTCARIALVLHMIEDPYSLELSQSIMRNAIQIVRGYVLPALRYTFLQIGDQQSVLQKWTAEHLIYISGLQDTVTLSDIRRSARRQWPEGMPQIQQEQELRIVLDELCKMGWIALIEESRRSVVYAINKQLSSRFESRRTEIILAKQRIKDSIVDRLIEEHKPMPKYPHVPGYHPSMKAA